MWRTSRLPSLSTVSESLTHSYQPATFASLFFSQRSICPVLVIATGSSVAAGKCATRAFSWAGYLERMLQAINPATAVSNVAEGGADTKRALALFPHVVPQVSFITLIYTSGGLSQSNRYHLCWGVENRCFKINVIGFLSMMCLQNVGVQRRAKACGGVQRCPLVITRVVQYDVEVHVHVRSFPNCVVIMSIGLSHVSI